MKPKAAKLCLNCQRDRQPDEVIFKIADEVLVLVFIFYSTQEFVMLLLLIWLGNLNLIICYVIVLEITGMNYLWNC